MRHVPLQEGTVTAVVSPTGAAAAEAGLLMSHHDFQMHQLQERKQRKEKERQAKELLQQPQTTGSYDENDDHDDNQNNESNKRRSSTICPTQVIANPAAGTIISHHDFQLQQRQKEKERKEKEREARESLTKPSEKSPSIRVLTSPTSGDDNGPNATNYLESTVPQIVSPFDFAMQQRQKVT